MRTFFLFLSLDRKWGVADFTRNGQVGPNEPNSPCMRGVIEGCGAVDAVSCILVIYKLGAYSIFLNLIHSISSLKTTTKKLTSLNLLTGQ